MKTFSNFASALLALYIAFTCTATSSAATTTTSTSQATADTAPAVLPQIMSKAELKLFALNQVTSGNVWIWSDQFVNTTDSVTSIYTDGADAGDVLQRLLSPSNQFKFKVRTTDAKIYVYGSLRNKDGYEVFYTNFTEVKTHGDSNGLQLQYMNLIFRMNSEIPIPFSGAYAARIEYTDANGSRWQDQLTVQDGKIYFPLEYAETQSTLIVSRQWPSNNGTSYDLDVVYDIATGTRTTPVTATGSIGYAAVQNHIEVTDQFLSNGQVFAFTTSMAPPANDQWNYVEPPTGAITLVSTQVGASRACIGTIYIGATPTQIGTVEAYAYDPTEIGLDGMPVKHQGTVTITPSSYPSNQTVVKVTWNLPNNGQTPGGAKFYWFLKTSGYESQRPPQAPYYGDTSKG